MKLAKIGALLLSFALLAGMLVACDNDKNGEEEIYQNGEPTPNNNVAAEPFALPTGFSGIDFADGNFAFLANHFKPLEASENTRFELSEFRGAPAVKVTPDGGSDVYIAIDAESILGDRITDVRRIEVTIGIETPGGFEAVSGIVRARAGEDSLGTANWNIFAESVNPRVVGLDLVNQMWPGENNMFVIERLEDAAVGSGKTAGNIFIIGIAFLDGSGNALSVNSSAEFNMYPSFNQIRLRNIDFREMNGSSGASFENPFGGSDKWWGWHTHGSFDNPALHFLAPDINLGQILVLEFSEPPRAAVDLVWLGQGNNWGWPSRQSVIPENGTETRFEFNLPQLFGRQFEGFSTSHQTHIYLGYHNYDDDDGNRVDVVAADLLEILVDAYLIAEVKTRVPLLLFGDYKTGTRNFPIAIDDANTRAGWFSIGDTEKEALLSMHNLFHGNFLVEELQQAHTLILEFDEILPGAIELSWEGEGGIGETIADIRPGGEMIRTKLILDLAEIFEDWGSAEFMSSSFLRLYIGYADMSLYELPITNATFIFD
jgi:hypothetical protein